MSSATVNPFNTCHEIDAPSSAADREAYATHLPAWMQGVVGQQRPVTPATDSGILSLLVVMMVLIGLNMRHVNRVFRSMFHDLLSVRRRANLFDEHTANEIRVVVLLVLLMCVMEGLLLFFAFGEVTPTTTSQQVLTTVLLLIGLAVAFYLFQVCACSVVGYVFTDKVSAALWRQGLNASQVCLGLALAVPAVVSLFYPAMVQPMLWLAAGLYLLSRICYIIKGFRIFYTDFSSLLYFILYLCTLEIIPVVAACFLAAEICVKA
jgi:hypothetical protein